MNSALPSRWQEILRREAATNASVLAAGVESLGRQNPVHRVHLRPVEPVMPSGAWPSDADENTR